MSETLTGQAVQSDALLAVVCDCGFRLGIRQHDLGEIAAGVWGTIPCPRCKARLNDKIQAIEVTANSAMTTKGEK